ncbi:MAG: uroporphyrinogen decarboxylase family protein [Saccharofermentanales bacterium]
MMSKKERFFATIERRDTDRPAWWSGLPADGSKKRLYEHFSVSNEKEFKLAINDDIWTIDVPYRSETANAIYEAFDFAKKHPSHANDERTLTAPGFFEDYDDSSAIGLFNWPDPAKYIDRGLCRKRVDDVPDGYPVMAMLWSAHFQDACAAFGMEEALVRMKTDPELFCAVIDRIVEFYLQANEIFYESTKGRLDAVLIGNDFGTQNGLLTSPEDLRRYVFGGTRKLIAQAHSYGLKVVHHSCGSVDAVIQDLIDAGVDAIHPIQALASGMDANSLKTHFGNKVSFCGGVDAQFLLVNGSPADVEKKVEDLCRLFPTGLIVSPSHEAILPDVDPSNIAAIGHAVQKFSKPI